MFEDLGLKYIGPIDGHDEPALEHALARARAFHGPVIVHVITEKGRGYRPAELDDAERFHAVGVLDPETGQSLTTGGPTWTSVFADELVQVGQDHPDVVAVSAAMLGPTGLNRFAAQFPDRTYDVGIAEQHAATSAAGMAFGGLHPVVAVYATFLNRAFDQVLMDCALHRAGVTFVLDRAGVTGEDGASHNGMWDLSLLQLIPGLALAAPRDGARLRELLREAVAIEDGPSVVRYPKGAVPADIVALERVDGIDILHRDDVSDVLVVAYGAMAVLALEVADRLRAQGIGVTVVDPRWVAPLAPTVIELARQHRLVVTVEDNGRVGGAGSTLAQHLRDNDVATPVRDFGIPQRFLDQGKPAQVRAAIGLTAQDVSRAVVEAMARLDEDAAEPARSEPTVSD
jgi:1-deoxy-D-xylulose-5-phosphate synthase